MLVDGQSVFLHIAQLLDAVVIGLEPSVATSAVASRAVGSRDVTVGAQTEGQRAVVDEGAHAHVLQLGVGDGLLESFKIVDFHLVEF